jgi:hypothetical protein
MKIDFCLVLKIHENFLFSKAPIYCDTENYFITSTYYFQRPKITERKMKRHIKIGKHDNKEKPVA